MKKLAFVLLLLPAVAMSMTIYKDGSIMLNPQEVENVERNVRELEEAIKQSAKTIEIQKKEIEELAKGGKCI